MLHLVDMRDKLAEAKARHAGQATSTTQPEAVPDNAGEPKAKSLGVAKSKSKALAFFESLSAPSAPGTEHLRLMTWTRPREDCTTTDCVRIEADGNELSLEFETIGTNDVADVMGMEDVKLVLLSFFDGIGAAHVALSNLGVKPCFAMSFETDEGCKSVIRAQFPDVELIGSYDLYAAEELMECVKKATAASDDLVTIVKAGPPCPDFSRIKGTTSKGRAGPEGEKFVKFCELLHALRAAAHSRGGGRSTSWSRTSS